MSKILVCKLHDKISQIQASFTDFDHMPYGVLVLNQINELIYYNDCADNFFNITRGLQKNYGKVDIITKYIINIDFDQNEQPRIATDFGSFVCNTFPVTRNKELFNVFLLRQIFCLCDPEMKETIEDCCIQKKLMESCFDGIYITDVKGTCLYFNDAFMRISGFSRKDCVGRTADEIVKLGYATKNISSDVINQRKSITTTDKYPNGSEAMISGNPVFDEKGNVVRVIFNVRDMTELNHLNEQLKKATALTAGYRQQLKEVQRGFVRDIICKSKAMENAIDLATRVANVDLPILILGESGTGKDVIANFIHNMSDRSQKGTMIQINCGAIPETLLESELFGYEKGAFTGAVDKGKVGLIDLASGGTLFLDEIGDMPLSLQVKLLDVIQQKRIMRLGGTKNIPIDVRIIAATNKNLEKMVNEGRFRLDLYYRLNVISINLPPLSQRTEDIIPLVEHFLKIFNKKHMKNKSLSPQALDRFLQYSWPGNVRELMNVLEQLVVTTKEDQINVEDLVKLRVIAPEENLYLNASLKGLTIKEYMELTEKEYIKRALGEHENLRQAADALGIDVSTLVRKKQKHRI